MALWVLGALLGALGLALYAFLKRKTQYWTRRGVPQAEPSLIFGNLKESLLGRRYLLGDFVAVYQEMAGNKYCGMYQMQQPVLMIRDPELAKLVLTKDFHAFASHGFPFDEENDPLSASLFNLDGSRWKSLRAKLSPTFTSGKLKLMLPLMRECVDELIGVLTSKSADGDVEMQDVLTRFATDVIGTCAFGVKCNSLHDRNAEFYLMSRQLLKPSTLMMMRMALLSVSPTLTNKLMPFRLIFPKANAFFLNLLKDTFEYRKKNKVVRNDFVKLMMDIRRADEERDSDVPDEINFTDNVMAAQAFTFFIAGLDNISNTVGFGIHELAVNPQVQDKAAAEVRRVLAKYNGELTYEAIKEMEYTSWVVDEASRKYSPGGALFRKVTVPEYTIPGTDVTLHAGDRVTVASSGMMMDPDYFPEPERFDPERFAEDVKGTRHPYTFLPFGEGPRFCIAERFAKLEMKVALAALINEFEFHVGPTTQVPIPLSKKMFSPAPDKGIPLKVTKRGK